MIYRPLGRDLLLAAARDVALTGAGPGAAATDRDTVSQLQHSSMDNGDHEGTNEEGEAAIIKRKTEETVDKKPSPSSET